MANMSAYDAVKAAMNYFLRCTKRSLDNDINNIAKLFRFATNFTSEKCSVVYENYGDGKIPVELGKKISYSSSYASSPNTVQSYTKNAPKIINNYIQQYEFTPQSLAPLLTFNQALSDLEQFVRPLSFSTSSFNGEFSIKELDYSTFMNFVNAYNAVKKMYNNINYMSVRNGMVPLYSGSSDNILLARYLYDIQALLFDNTSEFVRYYNLFKQAFVQTPQFGIARAGYASYVLSTEIATVLNPSPKTSPYGYYYVDDTFNGNSSVSTSQSLNTLYNM